MDLHAMILGEVFPGIVIPILTLTNRETMKDSQTFEELDDKASLHLCLIELLKNVRGTPVELPQDRRR